MPRIHIPHPVRRPSFGGKLRAGRTQGEYVDSGQAGFDVTMARLGAQREAQAAHANQQRETEVTKQVAQERMAQQKRDAEAQKHVDQVARNHQLWDQLVQADPNVAKHERSGYLLGVRDSGGNLAEAYKFVAHEDDVKNAAQKKLDAKAQEHVANVKAGMDYLHNLESTVPGFKENVGAHAHIEGLAQMGEPLAKIEQAYQFEETKARLEVTRKQAQDKYGNATTEELARALGEADSKGDAATASGIHGSVARRGLDEEVLWERYGQAKKLLDSMPGPTNPKDPKDVATQTTEFNRRLKAVQDARAAIDKFKAQSQPPVQTAPAANPAPAQAAPGPVVGANPAPSQKDMTVTPEAPTEAPQGAAPAIHPDLLKIGQATLQSLQQKYPNFDPQGDPAHRELFKAALKENAAAAAQQPAQPEPMTEEPPHDESIGGAPSPV